MRHQAKAQEFRAWRPVPRPSPSRDRPSPTDQRSAHHGVQAAEDRATGALLLRLLFSSGAVTPPDDGRSLPATRSGVVR